LHLAFSKARLVINNITFGSNLDQLVLPLFSVVIPTHNRQASLARCLNAIKDQDIAGDSFELLVVNDGSQDGTEQYLNDLEETYPFPLRVFHRQNSGPAKTRNFGIIQARGEWVVLLDDDCIPAKSWLRGYQEKIATSANPKVAGYGGKVKAYRPKSFYGGFFEAAGITRQNDFVDENNAENDRELKHIISANICFRRDILMALGGFDERFKRAAGEDTALAQLVHECGFKILYAPAAWTFHEDRESWGSVFKTAHNYGTGESTRAACEYIGKLDLLAPKMQKVIRATPLRRLRESNYPWYKKLIYHFMVKRFFKKMGEGEKSFNPSITNYSDNSIKPENAEATITPNYAVIVLLEDESSANQLAVSLFGLYDYQPIANLEWHFIHTTTPFKLKLPKSLKPDRTFDYSPDEGLRSCLKYLKEKSPVRNVLLLPKAWKVKPSLIHIFQARMLWSDQIDLYIPHHKMEGFRDLGFISANEGLKNTELLTNSCFVFQKRCIQHLELEQLNETELFFAPLISLIGTRSLIFHENYDFGSTTQRAIEPLSLDRAIQCQGERLYKIFQNTSKELTPYQASTIFPLLLKFKKLAEKYYRKKFNYVQQN
jgi:glycosyltransferase involved in cell wall biosynthesis